jgi:hypothetical protein
MKREPIYKALFQLVSSIDGLTTSSRILAHWDDVSPNEQPALFMAQDTQQAEQVTGFPTKYVLGAKVWIYAHRDTSNEVPSAQINNILDALDEVLMPSPSPTFKQTLGGLVEHCWISGAVETDEGTLGNQAVAIVPIQMLVVDAS